VTTRARMHPDDGDPRHGTLNGYTNLYCRCAACRAAWAKYYDETRENRSGRLWKSDVEHGTASAYSNWRCRCRACTTAWADYKRVSRAAKRVAS
jgi:hypothetical protein